MDSLYLQIACKHPSELTLTENVESAYIIGLERGITSYKSLAKALNVRGIPTANNRQWYGATIKNVLARVR